MPASSDLQHDRAVRQTAMDQGEQHVVAHWLQVERDVAGIAPGDGELARRIEIGDPALHPVLFGKAGRPLARRIG